MHRAKSPKKNLIGRSWTIFYYQSNVSNWNILLVQDYQNDNVQKNLNIYL